MSDEEYLALARLRATEIPYTAPGLNEYRPGFNLCIFVYLDGPLRGIRYEVQSVIGWPPPEVLSKCYGGTYHRIRYSGMPAWEADSLVVARAAEYVWKSEPPTNGGNQDVANRSGEGEIDYGRFEGVD